ncbi:MAG: anion permease, partial [Verrucomicrobiae bacterium]|nr:anion permease [Verrucomicrobiae bacterium]
MSHWPWKRIGMAAGLVVFLLMVIFYDPMPEQPQVGNMAAIAAFMAILWLSEAVPLAVTALIPLVTLPLFHILPGADAASSYVSSIV